MSMDRSAGRFRELDVLRGIAALCVVVFHYTRHGTRYYEDFPVDFWIGRYGVHLFFVISGFVIYYTLERSRTVVDFVFARFSRLYPTYWMALLMIAVIGIVVDSHLPWVTGYLVNMTMLQRFINYPDVDDVYWTLAIELTFYVLIAVLFVTGQLKRIVLFSFIWLVAQGVWGATHVYIPGAAEWSVATVFFILPYASYFVAGMMFYLIHSRGFHYSYGALIVLALIVAWITHGMTAGLITLGVFTLAALAVRGWLRFLVNPVTLWLGAISYPLYLVHRIPGYAFLDWMHARGESYLLAFVIAFCGALVLAHIVSITVERPSMRLLRNWYRQARPSLTPAPGAKGERA